ncbi:hypothetical protein ACFL27_17510 [candidate division CSSED10-310 bacterium]|uniref:HPr kinase/phosphorylase C-terminal domain-containing protein n=1 Tax=candidate division CSSED10-310 bacterium TaxID=2855610 RepID=A0ABV6Z0L6_UNCC1
MKTFPVIDESDPNTMKFEIADISVSVRSETPTVLTILSDFVKPFLVREPASRPSVNITINIGDSLPGKREFTTAFTLESWTDDGLEVWSADHNWIIYEPGISYFIKDEAGIRGIITTKTLQSPAYIAHRTFWFLLTKVLWEHSVYIIHAALVEKNGSRFLISGKSGSGKSTVALALGLTGYTVYADDACFFWQPEREVHFIPFARDIFIYPETVKLFPPQWQDLLTPASYDEDKNKMKICLPDQQKIDKPLLRPEFCLFPEITGRGEHQLKVLPKKDAVPRLLHQSMLFGHRVILSRQFYIITAMVQKMKFFHLSVGQHPILLHEILAGIDHES